MDMLPSIPAALTRAVYSGPTLADRPTMVCGGNFLFFSMSRISIVAAAPSMMGIIMSIRIQSYPGLPWLNLFVTWSTASCPCIAISRSAPHFKIENLAICWFMMLSSTSSTVMPLSSPVLPSAPSGTCVLISVFSAALISACSSRFCTTPSSESVVS